jgi:hypothetical protein
MIRADEQEGVRKLDAGVDGSGNRTGIHQACMGTDHGRHKFPNVIFLKVLLHLVSEQLRRRGIELSGHGRATEHRNLIAVTTSENTRKMEQNASGQA